MLLTLENIKKSFPVKGGFFGAPSGRVMAVNGIDLNIQAGENVALVGESGCGKTTLARIIMKLLPQDAGRVAFDGRDITHYSNQQLNEVRPHMQMVFQDPYSSLDPRFTIRRIMQEGLTLAPDRFKDTKDAAAHMEQMLGSVQLRGNILNRYPHEFSGGERQRIAIARALMLNPKLLVLDEAVSSLDVIIQKQIIDLLAELQKEYRLTYLFISHNLKVVRKISHKIAVMYKGKIIEYAGTEDIFAGPRHPYTRELLAAAIDYKAVPRNADFEIDPDAGLEDQGGGHFVIKS